MLTPIYYKSQESTHLPAAAIGLANVIVFFIKLGGKMSGSLMPCTAFGLKHGEK